MEDLPIKPSIAEMWRCLFNNDEPLQKLKVSVDTLHPFFRGRDIKKIILPQLGRQLQQN
jgi:hypothetical protein